MTKTEQKQLAKLITDVSNHPYRDELLQLMDEQVQDDTFTVQPQMFNA